MAISSSLPPFSWSPFSSSSPSLYFLYPYPHIQSSRSFNIPKFKLFCCHQTVQFDTQQINPKRKKRKPRPSFLEQIEDKWSVKPTSIRKKFPWEEQKEREGIEEEDDDDKEEIEKERVGKFSGTVSRTYKNSVVNDSVSVGYVNKSTKLAPWVQRKKPINPQIDFEARNVDTSSVRGKRVDEILDDCVPKFKKLGKVLKKAENFEEAVVDEILDDCVPKFKKLEKVLKKDEKFEEVVDDENVVAVPSGVLLDNKEEFFVKLDDKFLFERKSDQEEIGNLEDSEDECDSMRPLDVEEDRLRERMPWERESVEGENWRKSNTMLAEQMIPEPELKRLRNVALRMVERIKVGAAGITQALVDSIHEKWKVDEVVKLKFEGPTAINMKRSHDILERRTGGLVIWRSGSSIVLFRGMAYNLHCVKSFTKQHQSKVTVQQPLNNSINDTLTVTRDGSDSSSRSSIHDSVKYMEGLSEAEMTDLSELNFLLDEIGPRFVDWAGREPLPVDADLLPSVVPGYTSPFRLLPYGIRPVLRDKEMTFIRRAARTMPPHFALGRNRELQGLAKAMAKLWEKSAIAKIAIKRGVHNTRNERMAEELKILTGGTLVSRNKDYIVFYRGNDFLPPNVTETLVKAQNRTAIQQDEEDQARQKAFDSTESNTRASKGVPLVAGTLAETMAATSRWGNQPNNEEREKMARDLALVRHASLVRFLEKKLCLANGKVNKAEKALRKVQDYLEPSSLPDDLETLSDEERFLFRKIGLSMKPFLLLGRRGIFDGTIQNMHLHWKYRELVKIIVDGKRFAQVKHVAIALEAESGGVLVSVDKTTKGYAVIVYRGKNYQRPVAIKPKNLLTRRQALARSIELQRREALKHHISELQRKIKKLKLELEDMTTVNRIDEDTFYSRVDNASDNDDDDDDSVEEDEDEEAYLEIYDSGDEDAET